MVPAVTIDNFNRSRDFDQVFALWDIVFGYSTAHNAPSLAIEKQIAVNDKLFFVALSGASVVGTVIAGYDGHRGWIYSLGVLPQDTTGKESPQSYSGTPSPCSPSLVASRSTCKSWAETSR